ncbi:MAG: hypothetical protein K8F91_01360 [Candidatus Obscuribacterales bacterium]|nr:hypothetical protein [Candidatus Obscuribacterales bacterium]
MSENTFNTGDNAIVPPESRVAESLKPVDFDVDLRVDSTAAFTAGKTGGTIKLPGLEIEINQPDVPEAHGDKNQKSTGEILNDRDIPHYFPGIHGEGLPEDLREKLHFPDNPSHIKPTSVDSTTEPITGNGLPDLSELFNKWRKPEITISGNQDVDRNPDKQDDPNSPWEKLKRKDIPHYFPGIHGEGLPEDLREKLHFKKPSERISSIDRDDHLPRITFD